MRSSQLLTPLAARPAHNLYGPKEPHTRRRDYFTAAEAVQASSATTRRQLAKGRSQLPSVLAGATLPLVGLGDPDTAEVWRERPR